MIGVGEGSRSTARTMTDAITTVEGVAVSRCFDGVGWAKSELQLLKFIAELSIVTGTTA
jgi:hypothetical protein